MRLVDFQLSCRTAPTLDLGYFLAVCTDTKLRDKHFDDLMQEYYTALKCFLAVLGSNAEELLPYKKLLELLKERAVYGFIIATRLLFFILCDGKEIPDMEEMVENDNAFFESENEGKYRENINSLLQFYVDKDFDL